MKVTHTSTGSWKQAIAIVMKANARDTEAAVENAPRAKTEATCKPDTVQKVHKVKTAHPTEMMTTPQCWRQARSKVRISRNCTLRRTAKERDGGATVAITTDIRAESESGMEADRMGLGHGERTALKKTAVLATKDRARRSKLPHDIKSRRHRKGCTIMVTQRNSKNHRPIPIAKMNPLQAITQAAAGTTTNLILAMYLKPLPF